MTKRSVMISITTTRTEVAEDLFDWDESGVLEPDDGEGFDEPMELLAEGRLVTDPRRVELVYEEGELTGMAGARSTVTYRTADRGLVSMIRSGLVSTAMTFKAHHRAICTYETPYMPFSIGIHALTVDNRLDTEGVLKLDYIIEIRGARAERCEMTMKIQEDKSL